ncbi:MULTISPECIES: alpha/beta hydrolase family protein [Natrialbaceae]|uniref:alpha/beta hydrolase family protein n=1 Tax=Natrialbaceae TaxID=1644061 RepID=UPI00207CCFB7|nr:prolyl oligopeptidase family serine peptidase [Natronococcus sp. CG52]
MHQFNENVDGYYDVENQLPRYLRELADPQFEREDERRAAIDSVSAAEAHRERVREHFFEAIGGLPEERTDLNATCTGRLEYDGYTVEKVIFESLPGFHVTTNVYVPDGASPDEPRPAVLFVCGHAATAKTAEGYQQGCIDLVRNGFVVLAMDPIGQGERHQFYDPETGSIPVSDDSRDYPRTNTLEHTYLARQCTFAGANVARYFVWDGIRALDYLESRPEVDPDRLGVTGNSGGGMQTSYLMLADDRIAAAVPCCFITSKEAYMKTGQGQDGEQIVHRAIDRGPRYDDFLLAFAPKPALIGAAQSDFLCIEGTHQSYERASRVYDLYDEGDALELTVAESTHGFGPELREATVNWFRRHLADEPPTFETGDPATEDQDRLECTAAGEVRDAFPDGRTVVDLNREYVRETAPEAATAPNVDDEGAYARQLRERLVDRFDLERERPELHPRTIETGTDDGVTWEKVFFLSERNIVVTAVVVTADEAKSEEPLVLLLEEGTDEIEERCDEIGSLARDHGTVVVADPRGVGGVRSRNVNTRQQNGGGYDDYHGTVNKLASDALMLGTSLLALQTFDVLRAADYLESRLDGETTIAVEGHGLWGIHALLAAVVDPSIRSLSAVDPLPSFYEQATTEEIPVDHRLNVHGIVGEFDIPQLLPALADRETDWDGADLSRYR